ncbi:MAG: transporter substrate-binding domain-containing protein [Ruminiclostridium sp.]|nr:transporter substrate-binding domain-containing protein [Ruminiclostridium sp.]
MKNTTKGIISACIAAAVLIIAGCGQSSSPAPASTASAQSEGGSAIPNTVFSADDLAGKVIGTQIGTTGWIFAGDVENAEVEAYNKAADAIQALKQGKVDAVIIDSEPAKVFVDKNTDLTILSDPFVEEEYSIAYKIGNDELGKKIDDALMAIKADGTLDTIVSHWIGDDPDHVSYTPDSSVARSGKLIMATNAEFPPYESMESGEIVGIDVDMMRAVCDRIGMELEIENMQFDSIIAAVNSGKADVGVAGMSVTPERQKNVSFTQGYATSTQVIVVRK